MIIRPPANGQNRRARVGGVTGSPATADQSERIPACASRPIQNFSQFVGVTRCFAPILLPVEQSAPLMLDELFKVATALKALRAPVTA